MRIFLLVLILLAMPGLGHAQLRLSASVFGAGIIEANHASARLTGTLGQPFVGTTAAGSYTVEAGFWLVNLAPQATPIEPDAAEVPTHVQLNQNYPNPFNPQTTIGYALPQAGPVRLTIYDTRGREVARLVERQQPAGHHTVTFDARDLPSGAYFYRLMTGGTIKTGSMLLLK